ncbi:MAG: M20 family metallopeptidase [Actinomycetota bacterium]|nr:M20 family metallopeptidase [Actinomycetota bacterium]
MTPSIGSIRARVVRDRLIDRLQNMVRTPSENPPGNEAEVADVVARYCKDIGLDTELHEGAPGRPSVVARWSGGPGPTISYCSHIDVVPAGDPALWSDDPFSGRIDGNTLHGRGSCDAKGPVAAALEAVTALRALGWEPHGTLQLDLVADEEAMGFKGAGYLVEQGITKPTAAIVGEPTSLRVVRAQRGACWFTITTKGVAGHGSAPERGISAIKHAAEIVLRLEETLPDVSHPLLGGPSVNVGTIHGGAKVNIVPASCSFEVDRRSVPAESKEDVLASIQAAVDRARERFPDLDADVDFAFYAPPFEVPEDSALVRAAADAVGETTDSDAQLIGFRGASDARFLAEAGAEVIVLGPGDIALAHTARESVPLDEVEGAACAYALAFARLLGGS